MDLIKESPYELVYRVGAPFPAVDKLSRSLDVSSFEARVEAAIYYTLLSIESGLGEDDSSEFAIKVQRYSGSTCIPFGLLMLLAELLLNHEAEAKEIETAIMRMHRRKKLLVTRQQINNSAELFVYRTPVANMELHSAEIILERLNLSTEPRLKFERNLYQIIDEAQNYLDIRLSFEQRNAVYKALTNRISVITGGPGTGKTATQKILLEAYRRFSSGKSSLLVAPTGQAAKRMSRATGYPASTIHSALSIMPGEKNPLAGKKLDPGLLIVDEASMLDSLIFSILLRKTSPNTILVIVGDIDQLSSIGSGAVLRELIKCVPTTRLTKIFRQGDDSDIAFNAARIKNGTTKMIESDKFSFIEEAKSENIQQEVCKAYINLVEKYGLENVIVLTPYRKSTATGVNSLNVALRKSLGKDKAPHISHEGTHLYEGDKIIFLHNRYGLANGEMGIIENIAGKTCNCKFGEKIVKLSDSELDMIIPAFAQTIHKAQGTEYPCVVIVVDPAHSKLATRSIIYTAATRPRECVVFVGNKTTFENAIKSDPSERFSCLAAAVLKKLKS